jgi:hypothetical protein
MALMMRAPWCVFDGVGDFVIISVAFIVQFRLAAHKEIANFKISVYLSDKDSTTR